MCDLGASINLMPLSVYSTLNLGPLKQNGVVLTLADRSSVFPEGVLENVLVQVNDLIFPADFYVLDMEDNGTPNSRMLLLGRPFLKTARTMINVHEGTLSMEFDGAKIEFSINEAMKHPNDFSSVFAVNCANPLTEKVLELHDHSLQDVSAMMVKNKEPKAPDKATVLCKKTTKGAPKVNISLLDTAKRESKSVRFWKNFRTKKKKRTRERVVYVQKENPAIIHETLPPKKNDPGAKIYVLNDEKG